MSTRRDSASDPVPPQRILLVDDDDLELELMADRLRSLGFEIQTAADGSQALEALQSQPFQVVITDWQMPRMDGIQLTENLRSRGDTETYIIMLTVLDDSTSHERGYFAGVDDYLSKRAPDAKIVASVRAAFQAVEMRRALNAARADKEAPAASGTSANPLFERLRGEVKRAARYRRDLSVLVMELGLSESSGVADGIASRAASILAGTVRSDIDFAACYQGADGVERIAIVLPETTGAAAAMAGSRLCGAVVAGLGETGTTCVTRIGCASFNPVGMVLQQAQGHTEVVSLLRAAEAGIRAIIPSRQPPPPPSQQAGARRPT